MYIEKHTHTHTSYAKNNFFPTFGLVPKNKSKKSEQFLCLWVCLVFTYCTVRTNDGLVKFSTLNLGLERGRERTVFRDFWSVVFCLVHRVLIVSEWVIVAEMVGQGQQAGSGRADPRGLGWGPSTVAGFSPSPYKARERFARSESNLN